MTNTSNGEVRAAGDGRRRRRFVAPRVSAALGSGILACGLVLAATAAPAGAADSGTQGSAYGQLFQVTPYEGSLAAGAIFGEALAGHTNAFAKAQSQGMDLGAVGDSIKSYNCGAAQQQQVA